MNSDSGLDRGAEIVVAWARGEPSRTLEQRVVSPGAIFQFGVSSNGFMLPHNHMDSFRPVGRILAVGHSWLVSNYTTHVTFAIENLEGGAELIKVAPRRKDVAVPFEMSRLLIPAFDGLAEIKVFGQGPQLLDSDEPVNDAVAAPLVLNPESKYFRVLVALCEPRLRGSTMAPVPSVQEIVERLRGGVGFKNVTRSSVNYHIDYLHLHKLPQADRAISTSNGRLRSKREAIAYFALRHDLVREEHLMLLPNIRIRPSE